MPEKKVSLRCPSCSKKVSVPSELAGKVAVCPACDAKMRVPRPKKPTKPAGKSPTPEAAGPVAAEGRAWGWGQWSGRLMALLGAACLVGSAALPWVSGAPAGAEHVRAVFRRGVGPEWYYLAIPAALILGPVFLKKRSGRSILWGLVSGGTLAVAALMFQAWRTQIEGGSRPVLVAELSLRQVWSAFGAGPWVFLAGLGLTAGASLKSGLARVSVFLLNLLILGGAVAFAIAHVNWYFRPPTPRLAVETRTSEVITRDGKPGRTVRFQLRNESAAPAVLQVGEATAETRLRCSIALARKKPGEDWWTPVEFEPKSGQEEPAGAPWQRPQTEARHEPQAGFDYPAVIEPGETWTFERFFYPLFAVDPRGEPLEESKAGQWRVVVRHLGSGREQEQEFALREVVQPELAGARLMDEAEKLLAAGKHKEAEAKARQVQEEYGETRADQRAGRLLSVIEQSGERFAEIQRLIRAGQLQEAQRQIERRQWGQADLPEQQKSLLLGQIEAKRMEAARRLQQSGNPKQALELARKVETERLSEPERSRQARLLHDIGIQLARQGHASAGTEALQAALELEPGLGKTEQFQYVYALECDHPPGERIELIENYLEEHPQAHRAQRARLELAHAYVEQVAADASGEHESVEAHPLLQQAEQAFRTVARQAEDEALAEQAEMGLLEVRTWTGDAWQILESLYEKPSSEPRDRAISMARRRLGLGASLGEARDRREVELTLAMDLLRVDSAGDLVPLGEITKRHPVIWMGPEVEPLSQEDQQSLLEYVCDGGVVWIQCVPPSTFQMPVAPMPGSGAGQMPTRQCAPIYNIGGHVYSPHVILDGVRSVYADCGLRLVRPPERMEFRPLLGTSGQVVSWLCEVAKGSVVVLPARIDREQADGSRFMYNLKLYTMRRSPKLNPEESDHGQ